MNLKHENLQNMVLACMYIMYSLPTFFILRKREICNFDKSDLKYLLGRYVSLSMKQFNQLLTKDIRDNDIYIFRKSKFFNLL